MECYLDLIKPEDDPRRNRSDPEPDWIAEVQKVVKCQKILCSENVNVKVSSL
jgi:hypothetical protein